MYGFASKNDMKIKDTPGALKKESGLAQMIRMRKSIHHNWVNEKNCPHGF